MTDVIISVAHGPNSEQAEDGLFNEYTLSLMWSVLLRRELLLKNITCDVINEHIFYDKKTYINNVNPTLCLEIHFNSFHNGTVRGAETLYDPGSVLGEKYASIIQEEIKFLPNPDRGIKEGWYLGEVGRYLYFLHQTRCPALIIEPGFINAKEKLIEMAPTGVDLITRAIVKIL